MSLAFIYSAVPTCLVVYVQKSDFHFPRVVIVVKKCTMPCPGSLLLFCTAQQQDTFVATACDQSYTFVQPAVQTARWS